MKAHELARTLLEGPDEQVMYYDVKEREFVMSILARSEGEVVIPLKDGERFLAVYRQELFPEIQNGFQAYVRQCMLRDRVLRNAFGYPYHIMVDKIEPSDYKHYYAWIPQSTVCFPICNSLHIK